MTLVDLTDVEHLSSENSQLPITNDELRRLSDDARAYMASSKSAATLRAYRNDWVDFTSWCGRQGLTALPAEPETVALYLTDHASRKAVATLQRRITSISQAHQAAGLEPPTRAIVVRETWRGIRRTVGTASEGKAPARTGDIRAMVATLDDGHLIGLRDRALLLVGFAGALRRSELVALDHEDLLEIGEGLVLTLRRSKTDQEGAGEAIGVPYGSDPSTCPVRSLRRWLDRSEIISGPLFRSVTRHGTMSERRLSDRAVAEVVKRCAAAAGLDPTRYAAHSLRAGLITAAAEAGVLERDIMRHSRHKSVPVMRKYIRDASLFQSNAAAAVGL